MGDPRKHRKKYTTPLHPWRKDRLDIERELKIEYGVKNKTEIYRMDSLLRKIKSQMKKLTSSKGPQIDLEMKQLITKLNKLGLINDATNVDAVLGLELKNIMDRRLQTIVFKKGFANSVKQARQFITHEHVLVGDKKITSPGYLVATSEESMITFSPGSSLSNEDHPERVAAKKEIKREIEITKIKKEKSIDVDLDVPNLDEVNEDQEIIIPEEDAIDIEESMEEETKDE